MGWCLRRRPTQENGAHTEDLPEKMVPTEKTYLRRWCQQRRSTWEDSAHREHLPEGMMLRPTSGDDFKREALPDGEILSEKTYLRGRCYGEGTGLHGWNKVKEVLEGYAFAGVVKVLQHLQNKIPATMIKDLKTVTAKTTTDCMKLLAGVLGHYR